MPKRRTSLPPPRTHEAIDPRTPHSRNNRARLRLVFSSCSLLWTKTTTGGRDSGLFSFFIFHRFFSPAPAEKTQTRHTSSSNFVSPSFLLTTSQETASKNQSHTQHTTQAQPSSLTGAGKRAKQGRQEGRQAGGQIGQVCRCRPSRRSWSTSRARTHARTHPTCTPSPKTRPYQTGYTYRHVCRPRTLTTLPNKVVRAD